MTDHERDVKLEPFFLDADNKRLFCIYFPPAGEPRGNYLFLPPFAEEMNRSRSMVAMQSRALANRGFGVMLLDLFGTGESSGEFGDATWVSWKASAKAGYEWLAGRPGGRIGLWGLRLGAQLVTELLDEGVRSEHVILWQPVTNAKAMLTQFLRIKVAASMDLKVEVPSTDDMRKELGAGRSVEVGGYELNPELAVALDAAVFAAGEGILRAPVDWFEVSAAENAVLMPASAKVVDTLRARGAQVSADVCEGPPFWQLHERTLAPRLIASTTARVLDRHA
jgi:exosortase A-associated hydrolase 2